MKQPNQVSRSASGTTHTIITTVCVALSGFYLLPAGVGAIRNGRYLGTLFMLNIGVGFLLAASFGLFATAWLGLLMWSMMQTSSIPRPLY